MCEIFTLIGSKENCSPIDIIVPSEPFEGWATIGISEMAFDNTVPSRRNLKKKLNECLHKNSSRIYKADKHVSELLWKKCLWVNILKKCKEFLNRKKNAYQSKVVYFQQSHIANDHSDDIGRKICEIQ